MATFVVLVLWCAVSAILAQTAAGASAAVPLARDSATVPADTSNAALESHSAASTAIVLNAQEPLTRFTFGSCNKHSKPQPMWPHMIARQPQMFLWLGDVIYAGGSAASPYDLRRTRAQYALQHAQPEYTAFRQSIGPDRMLGIYDDNDYGMNDGDATYADKDTVRQMFLDFLDEPADSPRRTRDGIYQDYIWGPIGQRVKFILLDGRYNQDPVADDMLGSTQWHWLEESINADDNIDLYILGMGLQLVSFDKRIGEGWRLKPKSRARVFDLFERRRANRQAAVVFLSGDVHFAEADVTYRCHTPSDAAVSSSEVVVTPFYEFTSSGLTHSVGDLVTHPLANVFLSYMLDPRESYAEQQNASHSIRGWYAGTNFADVRIDWHQRTLTVEAVDQDNATRLCYHLPFIALAQSTYHNATALPNLIARRCRIEEVREHSPAGWTIRNIRRLLLWLFLTGLTCLTLGAITFRRWRARQHRDAALSAASKQASSTNDLSDARESVTHPNRSPQDRPPTLPTTVIRSRRAR